MELRDKIKSKTLTLQPKKELLLSIENGVKYKDLMYYWQPIVHLEYTMLKGRRSTRKKTQNYMNDYMNGFRPNDRMVRH